MSEIIPINNDGGKTTVNARDLHKFLEVGKDFSTWIKNRINKYGFTKSVDFTVVKSVPQNGGSVIDYHISTDMAKELSMVENNAKGREARLFFIERERAGRELAKAIEEANPLVLRKMADLAQERNDLIIENHELRPLADFAKTFAQCRGNFLMRDFAKMLSNNSGIEIGQKELFNWLYLNNYLIKGGRSHRAPYQRYISNGYFKLKSGIYQGNTQDYVNNTPTITPKGMSALGPKIIKEYRHETIERGA